MKRVPTCFARFRGFFFSCCAFCSKRGVLEEEEYVGSPLLLVDNSGKYASSLVIAPVLYACLSVEARAPACMISGGSGGGDGHMSGVNYSEYLDKIKVALRIRLDKNEAVWVASMVAGLTSTSCQP